MDYMLFFHWYFHYMNEDTAQYVMNLEELEWNNGG